MWAIGAAAGLVLLIACANVAVLMLVRSQRREREIALRVALGASRAQVLRLLVAEALWLGVAATITGVALAIVALQWLVPFIEGYLGRRIPGGGPRSRSIRNWPRSQSPAAWCRRLAFSLVPAMGLWRQSLASALAAGGRGATIRAADRAARSILIAFEVAVSLTLLTRRLLMTISALRMLAVDFGIQPGGVTTSAPRCGSSVSRPATRSPFSRRLRPPVGDVAGSRGGDERLVAAAAAPPRQFDAGTGSIVDGGAVGVSAGYFTALGVRILEGRPFSTADRFGSEPVAVVSESLARRLWTSSSAIGQTVRVSTRPQTGTPETLTYRVIGVAADVRQTHTDSNLLDAYVPLLQTAGRFTFLYLPVSTPTPAWERELREAVAAIDPEVAVGVPRALQAALDQERLKPRVLAWLLSAFAAFAALLALLGMYGVVSYAVQQREREVAVRMAIGADRRSVTGLFVRQGSLVLVAGVVAGTLGAIGMGRILSAQLYGVGRTDPVVIASAAALLMLCGLVAIWWPARRAASTDPAAVLKAE